MAGTFVGLARDKGACNIGIPVMDKVYRFEFEPDFHDYKRLCKSAYRAGKRKKVMVWGLAVLLIGNLVLFGLPYLDPNLAIHSPFLRGSFAGGLFGAGIVLVINFVFGDWLLKRAFAQSSIAGRRLIYEVSDKGVSLSTNGIVTHIDWPVFRHLEVLPDALFMFMDRRQAYILSKRGIDAAEWPPAVAFVTERCASGR